MYLSGCDVGGDSGERDRHASVPGVSTGRGPHELVQRFMPSRKRLLFPQQVQPQGQGMVSREQSALSAGHPWALSVLNDHSWQL